ncbi:MAG: hypothetical protein V3V40_05860 [Nitrosomonadaceae bacterium]
MIERIEIKVNMDFAPYHKGQILKVRSVNGVPVEQYWRDRIRDCEIDNCITVKMPVEKKTTEA